LRGPFFAQFPNNSAVIRGRSTERWSDIEEPDAGPAPSLAGGDYLTACRWSATSQRPKTGLAAVAAGVVIGTASWPIALSLSR